MKNEILGLAQELAYDFNRALDQEFIARVKLALIGYRATIIKEQYNKTGIFASSLLESFCVKLVQVSESECCSTGDSKCKVWRSEYKLPDPVRTKDGTNFVFVGNVNATEPYTFIQPEDYINIKKGTRFAKNLKFYTHYNGYIYIFNGGNNQKIRVRYIPDNPEELLDLKSCDGKPCIEEVSVPEDMKRLMKEWFKIEMNGKEVSKSEEIQVDGTK
jgi:hypothetical protein